MYPLSINNYSIIYLPSVDSTNNYAAMNEKQSNMQHKTVILTSFQSKGKGQFHNKWQSEKDQNLLFSIFIKPKQVKAIHQFDLSRLISLALRDCVSYFLKGVVSIKWPNDIFINDQKIAGILIENSLTKQNIERSIIGVGLNINQVAFEEINATSFKLISGKEWDLPRVLEYLLYRFDHYLETILPQRKELRTEFDHHLYLRNEWRSMKSTKQGQFLGKIMATEENGALLIEDQRQKVLRFDHKEINFS